MATVRITVRLPEELVACAPKVRPWPAADYTAGNTTMACSDLASLINEAKADGKHLSSSQTSGKVGHAAPWLV